MTNNKTEDIAEVYSLVAEAVKQKLRQNPEDLKASDLNACIAFLRLFDKSLHRDEQALAGLNEKKEQSQLIKDLVERAKKGAKKNG